MKPSIFISYCRENKKWADLLVDQLKVLERQGIIDTWYDGQIEAGADWEKELTQELNTCSVAVLLVSAGFLNSDYIQDVEAPLLLERRVKDHIQVIPLIVEPCAWQVVSWLTEIQIFNRERGPLSGEPDPNTVLAAMAAEIGQKVLAMSKKQPPKPKPEPKEEPEPAPSNPLNKTLFVSYHEQDEDQLAPVLAFFKSRGYGIQDSLDNAAGVEALLVFIGNADPEVNHAKPIQNKVQRYWEEHRQPLRLIPVFLPDVDVHLLVNLPAWLRSYSEIRLKDFGERDLELLSGAVEGRDTANAVLEFQERRGRYFLSFTLDDEEPAEGRFYFEMEPDSPESKALRALEKGSLTKITDGAEIGAPLWGELFYGEVKKAWQRIAWRQFAHFRLKLPESLEWLPWETLYDEIEDKYLLEDRMFSIIRDTPQDHEFSGKPTEVDEALKVLAVIPEASGLDEGSELRKMGAALSKLGKAVDFKVMNEAVTLANLQKLLAENPPDIFHFIGHGRIEEGGAMSIRLDEDSTWVEGQQFAALFKNASTHLVILNCCLSGRSFGAGKSLASRIYDYGVPAVIAMQYKIADRVALHFSEFFYKYLVSQPYPGRVDQALQHTRRRLLLEYNSNEMQAFMTPQLFLAPGRETLFKLRHFYSPPKQTAEVQPGDDQIPMDKIPPDLISALREGECIPVIGPGLLEELAMRDDPEDAQLGFPGPRRLAIRLNDLLSQSSELENPDWVAENALCNKAGDWYHTLFLHRTCQFWEQAVGRRRIVGAIQDIFNECLSQSPPPDLYLKLASWKTPGYICTWFDGLLEEALKDTKPLAGRRIDEQFHRRPGDPVLVNLTGHWDKGKNLAITELEVHQLIWQSFNEMSVELKDWILEKRHSLLFLGCSPKDELVARLGHRLFSSNMGYKLGKVYFAGCNHSPVDLAYWEQLDAECHWIPVRSEALISWITGKLGEGHE